jgi:hypothetical protein
MKQIGNIADTKVAANVITSSGGLTGAPKIDATGYGRARFVFNLGIPLTGASFNAIIFQAATSGATFNSNASAVLAQMTEGAGSCVAIIDMKVSSATPWLKVSGSGVGNSNWPASVTVDLYQGMNRAASPASVQQIVVV